MASVFLSAQSGCLTSRFEMLARQRRQVLGARQLYGADVAPRSGPRATRGGPPTRYPAARKTLSTAQAKWFGDDTALKREAHTVWARTGSGTHPRRLRPQPESVFEGPYPLACPPDIPSAFIDTRTDGLFDDERRVRVSGGCFFVAAAAELGGQSGPVHDAVAFYQRRWRELLTQAGEDAAAANELPPGTDPGQLAFELGVMLAGTNVVAVLRSDNVAIEQARRAIRDRVIS
jgi:hypothetical protein